MTQAKILIIGGSGYLGSHLSMYLTNQGHEVHNTGSKPSSKPNYYQLLFEDVNSFENLPETTFDLVLILAAKLNALGITNLDHPDLKSNTIGYAQFLEFFQKRKLADKIIYVSSMTVYSEQNAQPVPENGQIGPVNTYGLSKYLAENITSFFCERKQVSGIILRSPGIYGGDRKSGFIYHTIRKLKNNEAITLQTKGLIYWETIYINDLCEIIDTFISHYSWKVPFDIYNVCYGEETDMYATVYYLNKALGKDQSINEEEVKGYIPFWLSNEKLKTVIPLTKSYYNSLKEYLNVFEE